MGTAILLGGYYRPNGIIDLGTGPLPNVSASFAALMP